MEKTDNWRWRIFEEAEERYVEQVIRPALADLENTRASLQAKLDGGEIKDDETAALFHAEIQRVNGFERKLHEHVKDTRERFARRREGSAEL
jgi:hypothetical protein